MSRRRAPVHDRRNRAAPPDRAEVPDGVQDGLLAENPAPADYSSRESPEAALDLLRPTKER